MGRDEKEIEVDLMRTSGRERRSRDRGPIGWHHSLWHQARHQGQWCWAQHHRSWHRGVVMSCPWWCRCEYLGAMTCSMSYVTSVLYVMAPTSRVQKWNWFYEGSKREILTKKRCKIQKNVGMQALTQVQLVLSLKTNLVCDNCSRSQLEMGPHK